MNETLLLIGAGASKFAQLPLLDELTGEVEKRLKTVSEICHQTFETIRVTLANRPLASVEPNIEEILAVVDTLLVSRLPWQGLSLRDIAILEYEIRKSIWLQLSIHGALDKLDPLTDLIPKRGLDIYSLNNDLVIEDWCMTRGQSFVIGFDHNGKWRPDLFNQRRRDVRLYKLHGSIDWVYRTGQWLQRIDLSGITRKPDGTSVLRSPVGDLQLVFPSQIKVVVNGPLVSLHTRFQTQLQQARTVFVIGCRLYDEHIYRTIVDALAVNKDLRVGVVSPNPYDVVDRIARRKSPLSIKRRVDGLPFKFESSITGPIRDYIRSVRSGKTSVPNDIRRAMQDLPADDSCRTLSLRLRRRRADTPDERHYLESVIRNLIHLIPIGSSREFLRDMLEDIQHQLPTERLPALGRALAEMPSRMTGRFLGSCIGLATSDGALYAIGGAPQRVCHVDTEWKYRAMGPPLHDAYGLAVLCGRAFVVERKRLNREGVGALRSIDLRSGLSQCVLPTINSEFVGRLRELWKARKGAVRSVELQALGFLSYPTAVRIVDSRHLLVVESRRICCIKAESGEIVQRSEPVFLNLADAAVSDNTAFLIEGGTRGFGRIVRINLSTMKHECLLDGVSQIGGVAVDDVKHVVLFSISAEWPDGKVIQIPYVRGSLHAHEPRVLVEHLHVPRYFCSTPDGQWYCSTAAGLIRFAAY